MEKDRRAEEKSARVLHYYEIGNEQKCCENKALSVEEVTAYW